MVNPRITRVYKGINKPLLIWGVDRRLFFLALIVGASTFNFFGSALGGVLMFVALYLAARACTTYDADLPRIVLASARFRSVYDPLKVERDRDIR